MKLLKDELRDWNAIHPALYRGNKDVYEYVWSNVKAEVNVVWINVRALLHYDLMGW